MPPSCQLVTSFAPMSVLQVTTDDQLSISYIEWRAAIGLWLMIILLIAAISEISFLAKHFTRFSEEIFTGIVSLFFIFEASLSIYHVSVL